MYEGHEGAAFHERESSFNYDPQTEEVNAYLRYLRAKIAADKAEKAEQK